MKMMSPLMYNTLISPLKLLIPLKNENIAQEVMSYKSNCDGSQIPAASILQPPAYGSNLRRKESMSVQDRETLERSKQAAAQTRSRSELWGKTILWLHQPWQVIQIFNIWKSKN
ncbi:unnamed protein product [Absidia cylindrospora]